VVAAIFGSFLFYALTAAAIGLADSDSLDWQHIVLLYVWIAIAFVPVWIYGSRWNAHPLELMDKRTGQDITIKNPHSFIWIPMQYWAIIYPLLVGAILLFAGQS